MNKYEVDKLIEDSISVNLDKYELQDEVLLKIKDNIKGNKKGINYKVIRGIFPGIKPLRTAAAIMCSLIMLCSFSLLFSANARVFASEAINAIKTIFAIDDNGQVVEVGQDVPLINNGYSIPTDLSDIEINKKVGFNFILPETLSDGFNLAGKRIGIFLGKDISYETNEDIKTICQNAVLDDTSFESLKEYNPSRSVSGIYSNPEGKFSISINSLTDKYNKGLESLKKSKSNYKEIKIGDIKGIWIEQPRPIYSTYDEDTPDMTQKPVRIVNTYDICWVANDLIYFMSTSLEMNTNGCKLSPEAGARIAESFMASQKQN